MISRYLQSVLLLLAMVLAGCGGGGGAISAVRVSGNVLDISTGAPLTSTTTVQSDSATVNADLSDGSFLVGSPKNATQLVVNPPAISTYPSFIYKFAPFTLAQTDVQTLWVGPQKVIVRGTVRNAADGVGIANALVRFGGQRTTTDATGLFSVADVAYHPTNTATFLGLVGQAEATGFLLNEFTTNGNLASGGVVNVGDVLITPIDSTTPPTLPFNIWGIISPGANASGTIVTLKDSGGTVVRRFTVGSDFRYQFWVNSGSYRIEFQKGSLSAPAQNVTLGATSDVVRADATLS